MRITEKTQYGYENGECVITECSDKLGQLEDIEELCEKIVSQPIYKKFINTRSIRKKDYTEYDVSYNFKERSIYIYGYEFIDCLELEKYGKTWALTKDELL